MRAEELIEEIEKIYPDSLLMIDSLSEKDRIEYVAVIKLVQHMKLIINPTPTKRKK